jgi:hypothetical protein
MPDQDLIEKLENAGLPATWAGIINRLYNQKEKFPCGAAVNFGGNAKLRMEVAFRTWDDHFTVFRNEQVTHTFTLTAENTLTVEQEPKKLSVWGFTRNGTPAKKRNYLAGNFPSTHFANLTCKNPAMPRDWGFKYEGIHHWNHPTAKAVFGKPDLQFKGECLYRCYFLQYINPDKPEIPVNLVLVCDPAGSSKGSTLEIEMLPESNTAVIKKMLPEILENLHDLYQEELKKRNLTIKP